jgi:type I restriction enzyme S subunit
VGELPEGWESRKLGDLVEFFYGYPFDSSKFNDEGRGHPVIRIRDLLKHSTKTFYDGEFDRSYLINEGDILIGMDGEFNIVRWKGTSALLNQRNCKLKIKSDEILDGYLFRVLVKILKDIEGATPFVTVKHLSAKQLNSIYLPLPPLPIQRQIVAVLEQAEAVKRQRQEADALTGALLQSVFYEMFGDPVRNEKGFDIANLNEICDEITVGVVVKPASYYVENGIPALRSLNIKPDRLDLTNLVYFNSADNDTVLAKSKINTGDVLVVRTGYPGTACVVPPELDGANCIDLIILRPKKDTVNSDYLSRFLNSEYGKAQALAGNTGLAQQHLNIGAIRQVKIPLPPLALQQEFARVVESVERLREKQVESGRQIEGLCGGLMARAFAGELAISQ